jgi:CDP-paratose 2-epimerase
MTKPVGDKAPILIVGGAGFIGSNLARSLLADGKHVVIFDNLSRAGVERNLDWLRKEAGIRLRFIRADIRDADALTKALAGVSAVYHLAAQTAVTTSLVDPQDDFAVNAQGTLNVLEAVRRSGRRIPVIFSSTNKVYGGLDDVAVLPDAQSYLPRNRDLRAHGIDEDRKLDFCTPYGCSKGVADQYVLDYASSFDLPTAVLRMSCIYGPRQFGTEDQGWVAHFLIAALSGDRITVYGDGKQVRDVLFVDDAIAAYRAVLDNIETVKGRAFNLGGGPGNAVSVNQVLAEIERITGRSLDLGHGSWRQGDQYYFVADTRRLEKELGWRATVDWRSGMARLLGWLVDEGVHAKRTAARRAVA